MTYAPNRHAMRFVARDSDIDVNGHVNNAVWLGWMEQLATAHWQRVAAPAHVEAYAWFVTRHEIDYRGNIGPGDAVRGETRIEKPPRGARFERLVDFFRDVDGPDAKAIVSARSTWAMIDRRSGRLMRVPQDVSAPFLDGAGLSR